ncbi:MAG TPA: protease pro-enzyme activation domain-containing protein, partial [Verrucomicrobiae bacterium]|nr:protease pro-enzyme activation domain-containing protein [Verrucomicrobiae bacterium]
MLFTSVHAEAQSPIQERVSTIDETSLQTLRGNTHPLPKLGYDQGIVESAQPMRVKLFLRMSTNQQTALGTLLARQQERGSPDYHRWITPEEFGSRFGLNPADIEKVTAWLERNGFQVEPVPASRNMIAFRGSAQQVQSVLHTEIHRYLADGESHFANSGDPSVPAAIANVVLAVRGLDNFRLKPGIARHLKPRFTDGQTGDHFLTPGDFATIYDVKRLYLQSIDGTGQIIAVVGQSDVVLSDVQTFRANSSLTRNDPVPVNLNNPGLVGLVV